MRLVGSMAFCVVFVAVAGALSAQDKPPSSATWDPNNKTQKKQASTIRSLDGVITDASDKPVVNAVVQLKDMKTLQVRSFYSKDGGKYHFSGLKKDTDYQVTASLNGMTSATKTLSVFDSREEPLLDLKIDKPEKK